MSLSTYANCMQLRNLMAVYLDMDVLTSHCMLLHILAAFSHMDHFKISVLGNIIGLCIGSVIVD
jgi:hypothetical protein